MNVDRDRFEIQVNGEPRDVPEGATLASLLEALDLDPRVVAIERSGEVVPRALFGETVLGAGDRVEIVRFVQGG